MIEPLPLVSVVVVYAARLVELKTKRDTVRGPVLETRTLRLFLLSGTLMLALALVENLWRKTGLSWFTFAAGWLCALGSFWLRRRAIAALGKFWSLHVEIRDHHEFVCNGPFRWVRHPTYFSMILELLSAAFILQAPLALAAVSALFIPVLVTRVRLEEAALIEKFGDAYREYQRATPAIFPWKLPAK
ncbi:MAG: isoprenylcysteine carboxylmethyltransferase family protein [Verrucomicrobia bacterium]|nr:isoprenylcysteine carboxylmethyltransferase family protein [Verrucomicrobiota bacterium]